MPEEPFGSLWKVLVLAGVLLVAAGALLWLVQRGLPLGRLPGDIVIRGRRVTIFLPLATSLLLSLLLTLLLNMLWRR